MITQIEETIQKNLQDPEYVKELQRHCNKFFFYSKGGWISENSLIERLEPKKELRTQFLVDSARTILIALLITGRAISKTERDQVTRYKFTEDIDTHIEFLQKRKEMLKLEVDWINKKLTEFKKEQLTKIKHKKKPD